MYPVFFLSTINVKLWQESHVGDRLLQLLWCEHSKTCGHSTDNNHYDILFWKTIESKHDTGTLVLKLIGLLITNCHLNVL